MEPTKVPHIDPTLGHSYIWRWWPTGGSGCGRARGSAKFAGPAAQGVSDPVFELFLLDVFDNCSLPGAQVGEIRCAGYCSDTPRIPVREEHRSNIVQWRSWGPPRGVFGRFSCRPSSAHVSGGLRGPFWEPFWPQKCFFWTSVLVPWVLILELIFNRFLLRVPSEI